VPTVVNKILDLSAALGLYDWWASRSLGEVHGTLIDLADLCGDEEVLDVGCGTGMLSSRLAKVSDGIFVRGVDIGPRMIAVAEKRVGGHHPNVEFRVGSAVRLPYSDEQFDIVSSCLLFHLLQDSEKELALREIFRVLKPGGRYVCAEFEKYPARLFCRRLLEYPSDLIAIVGFDIDAQFAGPSITKCRSIVYRALTKPGD
jgi:ubiquinone/menaquinone biosynthesis C-methylase UbiE